MCSDHSCYSQTGCFVWSWDVVGGSVSQEETNNQRARNGHQGDIDTDAVICYVAIFSVSHESATQEVTTYNLYSIVFIRQWMYIVGAFAASGSSDSSVCLHKAYLKVDIRSMMVKKNRLRLEYSKCQITDADLLRNSLFWLMQEKRGGVRCNSIQSDRNRIYTIRLNLIRFDAIQFWDSILSILSRWTKTRSNSNNPKLRVMCKSKAL